MLRYSKIPSGFDMRCLFRTSDVTIRLHQEKTVIQIGGRLGTC